MSILIRAALLGGLAYVVSRAVKNHDLHHADDKRRLSRFNDSSEDEAWPTSDHPSKVRV